MNNPGSDLLSHAVTHAMPSAVESLTSVFGMGTGVTSSYDHREIECLGFSPSLAVRATADKRV